MKNSDNESKFRHEMKYICSGVQLEIIKSRLKHIMPVDKHANFSEGYNIRSIYFDNYCNKCYFENENGVDPREKFRIRIYNARDERISLECKRKERGKTQKYSCLISKEQYFSIMNGKISEQILDSDLLRKFFVLYKTQMIRPKVIVEYDRIPFVCNLGNVRVTLDKNIRTSTRFDLFFENNLCSRPIMPLGHHLLEVKYDEFIPDYIKEIIQMENLQQTAYSKYYLCRRYLIRGLL